MIKKMQALSLAETEKLIEEHGGSKEPEQYLKKFKKLNYKNSIALREEIEALQSHKIKGENVVKIIDFLPEDASDINKIFSDISLDENEIKQITEIVAKYK